jgi:hypothetical protein
MSNSKLVQGGEGVEATSLKVGVSLTGILSGNPMVALNIPVSSQTRQIGNDAKTLVGDLTHMTTQLKESGFIEKMRNFGNTMETVTSKIMGAMGETVDIFSSIELVLETILGLNSLIGLLTTPLTPITVLTSVYSIFKLIRLYIFRLPAFIRTAILGYESIFNKEEEFFDVCDMPVAEGPMLVNMAYTGLIMMLPKGVRDVLDAFQRYTRIKILEDLDWIFQIADVVLHIPTYVMQLILKATSKIEASWAKSFSTSLVEALNRYESLLMFIPELSTSRLIAKMSTMLQEIHDDRRNLMKADFVQALHGVISQVEDHALALRTVRNSVPQNMQAMLTEMKNFYRSGVFMVQKSHPEPVAVLLYSTPGVGKTTFIQLCRNYLTGAGKNTIYDYTPTDSRSDFHDQYQDQNVWIHEDIGQRGEQDWAQYIIHIGCNPSRMDGAALDKKSTIFFRSQVVLATTNIPIHRRNLTPVLNCGWKDVGAINRRWLVVEYRREADQCLVFHFDTASNRWIQHKETVDCKSPKVFCDWMQGLYKENVDRFKATVKVDYGAADYCFADLLAEGRKKEVVLDNTQMDAPVIDTEIDVEYVHPRYQMVTFDSKSEEINFSEHQQRQFLHDGLLINGGTEVVGIGSAHVGTEQGWIEYLRNKMEGFKEDLVTRAMSLVDFITSAYQALTSQVPQEYLITVGIFSGLGLLITMGLGMYWTLKPPSKVEEYEPFISWAKVNKRMTAKDLYAEGRRLMLDFQPAPSSAIQAIQKNVLRTTFTYGMTNTYGYGIMIDADTMITTAHLLLEEPDEPKDVFVRGEDNEDRERVSAFFTPIRWDYEEDLVVLKYRNAHQQTFRSLHRSLLKTPSNKTIYIVTTEGTLTVGEPQKCEVSSGVYRTRNRVFHMPHSITHKYDGQALSAPGLCGALAVTQDGYIVGWHVAGGRDGVGYVRFWNNSMRAMINTAPDVPVVGLRENSEIKGAMVIEDDSYHHITLTSGIRPSAMLEHMMKNPVLCPDGEPIRVPAELGGTREVDGVLHRTYDYSRTKNLSKTENPINLRALDFATAYVKHMIDSVLPDHKIEKLTDDEICQGFRNEDGVMKKMNMDASAGIPLGGTVSDWINAKGIHPKVKQLMQEVEKAAAKGEKNYDKVIFKDCNKDEMRDASKKDKPRCFAAGPLHFTLLLRRWFGRLNALFMKNRHRTGIMVGINATSREWSRLWKRLCCFTNFFDGDYKMWDGGMRREFQERLNEILASFTENSRLAATLLMYLCETTRAGMDMTYVTTHSVPSGHGLTSLYNSLINKMYLAYAWYILVGQYMNLSTAALIAQMDMDVYPPVYGDDVVAAVHSRVADRFNAITYGMVMKDIGIGFTSAGKSEHNKPFIPLRDISFLKRTFYANRQINDIVGPLSIDVLKASTGFVHDSARDQEITTQKMGSVQRELFLHSPEVYDRTWNALTSCYESAFGIEYVGLSRSDMLRMYDAGELRSDMFEAYAESSVGLPSRRRSRNKCQW